MKSNLQSWFRVNNVDEIPSPALLVYPDRIRNNIAKMVRIAGSPERLCPHVKTNKMPAVVQLYRDAGIRRFKCATPAEAEMVATCGPAQILLAMQPVGPQAKRLAKLAIAFDQSQFAVVVDAVDTVRHLDEICGQSNTRLEVLVDLDVGMHRTGIQPADAIKVYECIEEARNLDAGGLHVYDGHIRDADFETRRRNVASALQPVDELCGQLERRELAIPNIVAGGTGTFPIHALSQDRICSPGTTVFWDLQSERDFKDLDFQCAALVLTRVVSKPTADLICLDLGHKAIASEMAPPRVSLFGLEDAEQVVHSEEHLVIRSSSASSTSVGDVFYGVPYHICPTVALHESAWVIRDGRASEEWPVTARGRSLQLPTIA